MNPREPVLPEQMDVETASATVDRIQKHANILEEQKQKLQEEHAGMVESLKIIRPFRRSDYDISINPEIQIYPLSVRTDRETISPEI